MYMKIVNMFLALTLILKVERCMDLGFFAIIFKFVQGVTMVGARVVHAEVAIHVDRDVRTVRSEWLVFTLCKEMCGSKQKGGCAQ